MSSIRIASNCFHVKQGENFVCYTKLPNFQNKSRKRNYMWPSTSLWLSIRMLLVIWRTVTKAYLWCVIFQKLSVDNWKTLSRSIYATQELQMRNSIHPFHGEYCSISISILKLTSDGLNIMILEVNWNEASWESE